MNEKLNDKSEKTQVEGIIKEDRVIISDPEAIQEFYYNSYIGELEKEESGTESLSLNPVEVLLLSERKRLLIYIDNDKNMDIYNFENLLEHFSHYDDKLWHKYVIYMDLRKRGYLVRSGYGEGIEFRVYKRGANFETDSARYLIYPVFEGSPIELRDLDKISRVALSSRKDLIVATVDRLSRPIYYSVNKFEIINNVEINEEDYAR